MSKTHPFIPYHPERFSESEMMHRAESFFQLMNKRRTVREFSDDPVPMELIRKLIMTASTAPSGANKQPWTFCIITNPELKQQIRLAAEKEEKRNYEERMSKRWLEDLEHLETDWQKAFLEEAPCLVAVFKRVYELEESEEKHNNYYVSESVGLATGLFIAAIHQAGLSSLTYTPSPMNFLSKLLKRPDNERPYLLIPIGYPAANAMIPDQPRISEEKVIFSYA